MIMTITNGEGGENPQDIDPVTRRRDLYIRQWVVPSYFSFGVCHFKNMCDDLVVYGNEIMNHN